MSADHESKRDARASADYSYEAFGREFFEQSVTRERVENALSNLAGNAIDFGPRKAGPAGLASISATGEVGAPRVERVPGKRVRFAVTIPIRLQLVVRLAGHDHRFDGELGAHLTLTAMARAPLKIFIDVPAPTEKDVDVDVEAQGLRASVLDVVADVDGELRRFVARHIGREIEKPKIRDMREIDVAARLHKDRG
ncbi:hypothetical protein [Salinisphaera aquimarina]|uniref:DUF2589 domain-containing protein n=1 Tax=Salinisphaera aquimarina TaxID=2094031 RepID=A0ABV7ER55_9GAMM